MLEAEITTTGDVMVEGQHIGHLHGFRFTADPLAAGEAARALNAAAAKALAGEIEGRAARVHEAVDEAFVLTHDGTVRWLGEAVGKLIAGEHILKPRGQVLADDQLTGTALELVQRRLDLWIGQHVTKLLGPVIDIETHATLEGTARGIGFQIAEALGVLERAKVADQMKSLDQDGRAALRKLGVRFGAYHLYLPLQLKPAPRALAAQLWALKHGGSHEVKGIEEVPHLAASGRTSFAADKEVAKGFYRAAGFRVCGERAVRVDILERLADLIRPAIAYRPGVTPGSPPPGTADGDGFVISVAMTSLAGCSGENFAAILRSLGYQPKQRKGPAITVPLLAAAPMEPIRPMIAAEPENADVRATDIGGAQPEQPARPEGHAEVAAEVAAAVAVDAEPAPTAMEPEVAIETPAPMPEHAEPVEAAALQPEASAIAAEPVPEPEIPLIEVWHPHRHVVHQARRPERNSEHAGQRRQHNRAAPAAATDTTTVPATDTAEPSRERQERHRRPGQGKAPGASRRDGYRQTTGNATGEPVAAAPVRQDAGRAGNERHGNERHGQQRPPRHGTKGPEGRSRPDNSRTDDRRSQPRGTFASTETIAPRDRAPDPDSPFAKLLALKAQLENKGKKE